jgi:flagellar biogenesis protein FliO
MMIGLVIALVLLAGYVLYKVGQGMDDESN